MAFPESPRVIYERNTLEEVVCQVKFPAILRISETPVAFQERIRGHFPLLEQRPVIAFPPGMPPAILKAMSANSSDVFLFLSRDKAWTVTLFREFLSLRTIHYRRWEEFRELFEECFGALNEIYHPAFFQRVGLRYRDVIHRDKLELDRVPWPELLRPEVCGELAAAEPEVRDQIEHAAREVIVGLGDGKKVRIAHWLGAKGNSYVIDADFFIESEVDATNVPELLNSFKLESWRMFRWAIRERLHDAMRPTSVV